MIIRNKKEYLVILEIGVKVSGGTYFTKRVFPTLEGKKIKELIKTKLFAGCPIYSLAVVKDSIVIRRG